MDVLAGLGVVAATVGAAGLTGRWVAGLLGGAGPSDVTGGGAATRAVAPPPCPVALDVRDWIETQLLWLRECLGDEACRGPVVGLDVLPAAAGFRGGWWQTERLLIRLSRAVGVDPWHVLLLVFDGTPRPGTVPEGQDDPNGPADPDGLDDMRLLGVAVHREEFSAIGVNRSEELSPLRTAAVLAHELAHVRLHLLDEYERSRSDHEALTDLTAVYVGCGVLLANWAGSMARPARYLAPEALGYALACLALMRGEADPTWADDLEGPAAAAFRLGVAHLAHLHPDGSLGPGGPVRG